MSCGMTWTSNTPVQLPGWRSPQLVIDINVLKAEKFRFMVPDSDLSRGFPEIAENDSTGPFEQHLERNLHASGEENCGS